MSVSDQIFTYLIQFLRTFRTNLIYRIFFMVTCEIKTKTHGKYLSKVNSCDRFAPFIILFQSGRTRVLSPEFKMDQAGFTDSMPLLLSNMEQLKQKNDLGANASVQPIGQCTYIGIQYFQFLAKSNANLFNLFLERCFWTVAFKTILNHSV